MVEPEAQGEIIVGNSRDPLDGGEESALISRG